MATTELRLLAGSSSVIPGPTNIGVIETDAGAYLVDSGNDKEAGRKINKLFGERALELRGIVATHSNADHIGANDYLQRLTGCRIFSARAEKAFIESPSIEAAFLWGGYTPNALKNKFFEAKPSNVTDVFADGDELPCGLTAVSLPGHFFEMTGFVSRDGVAYLGDALFGDAVLAKYKIPFIYDVAQFRSSIEKIKTLDAEYFVPSHGEVERDIAATAALNLSKVAEVEGILIDSLGERRSFEYLLKTLCDRMGVTLEVGQYALIGSTVRSFLSYLANEGAIEYEFADNAMLWRRTK